MTGRSWPADVRQAFDPRLRARDTRQRRRQAEHFAGLLASHQIQITGHAQGHTDPLAAGGAFLAHLRGNGAAPTLELRQQLERPVATADLSARRPSLEVMAVLTTVAWALATSWSGETGFTM